jgi:ATP-dependent Lon protease
VVPEISAVVMTGYSTIDTAVKALRSGAIDFITKPFNIFDLREAVAHAVERTRLTRTRRAPASWCRSSRSARLDGGG